MYRKNLAVSRAVSCEYERNPTTNCLCSVQLCRTIVKRVRGEVNVLRKRFSVPLGNFHSITVAPYLSIFTDAPDGCFTMTKLSFFSIAIDARNWRCTAFFLENTWLW